MPEEAQADARPAFRTSLRVLDVSKGFEGVQALKHVNLELRTAEVHALLGANGSGKSTLVKVLSGVYEPDEGLIDAFGQTFRSLAPPALALTRLGIRVVHQEAPVVDSLKVAEAVALFSGYGASALGRVRWRALRSRVRRLLDLVGVDVELDMLCGELAPADRAGLALAIALSDLVGEGAVEGAGQPRILILDEVTAPLPEAEATRHLERVRRIADNGLVVLMVTHRLSELRIADRFTVLRDGAVVQSGPAHEGLDHVEIVRQITGAPDHAVVNRPNGAITHGDTQAKSSLFSRLWSYADRKEQLETDGGPAIEVEGLRRSNLAGLSFVARRGEIVGFAGLRGSGIEELPLVLGGGLPADGVVKIAGHRLPIPPDPRAAIRAGVALVPADRLRNGGVATLSVAENIVLPDLRRYWHQKELRTRVVQSVIDGFSVQPRDPEAPFSTLSGGNQQKVLMGKWLSLVPRVLVLDDPTYGVDPGARETVFKAIIDAAGLGVCVLFFSTEPEQLVRICNRVVVLRRGTVGMELAGESLSLETVTQWCYE